MPSSLAAAAATSGAAWATWFGFPSPCAGPYDVPVSLFAATLPNASAGAAWAVSRPYSLAPLQMSSVGGMWAALSTDAAGNRAWQTWCLMDGTVILTQASFEMGAGLEPKIDGVCRIPYILYGITYFDARVEPRGPFMFFEDKILSFWLPANASSMSDEASAGSAFVPRSTAQSGGAAAPRVLRDHEPFRGPTPEALSAAERERIAAFLAATPDCGTANVSTFENYAGSWMVRFDGGLLPQPTALTLSDAEESNAAITATFYDVMSGLVTAATRPMPFECDNGGKPCFGDYAWMEWRNETVLVSGDDDFRLGASVVVMGEPRAWLAAPANASLATLVGIGAEGTSSFTQSFESRGGPAAPFPLLLQQVTDNSFSCKASPTTDQVVGFSILDALGNWSETAPSRLVTCPSFGAAAASSCMTPLVVAWQPLVGA